MKLQNQMSTGNWMDVDDNRVEEFISHCVQQNQRVGRGRDWVTMDRNQVIAYLESGHELRNGSDWYDRCRCIEAHDRIIEKRRAAAPPVEMVKCGCGCTIPSTLVMSASLGSSCSECYDEMSN